MLSEQQRSVIRYWEIRRVIFNALLLADAWFGWSISNAFNAGIDDIPAARISDPGVIGRFVLVFAVFNVAFCIGYAVEFIARRRRRFWPRPLRSCLFVAVCLAAIWAGGGQSGKIAKEAAYTKAGVFGYGKDKRP